MAVAHQQKIGHFNAIPRNSVTRTSPPTNTTLRTDTKIGLYATQYMDANGAKKCLPEFSEIIFLEFMLKNCCNLQTLERLQKMRVLKN